MSKYFFISYFYNDGSTSGSGDVVFQTNVNFPSRKSIEGAIKKNGSVKGNIIIVNIIEFNKEQFELFIEE